MSTNAVAMCEHCGDELPVVVDDDGTVQTLRPGESCECGDEAFLLVDPAETSGRSAAVESGDLEAV